MTTAALSTHQLWSLQGCLTCTRHCSDSFQLLPCLAVAVYCALSQLLCLGENLAASAGVSQRAAQVHPCILHTTLLQQAASVVMHLMLYPRAVLCLQVFNTVIGKMVTAVLWMSPVGIASLIAASICRACDLAHTLAALGFWVLTVLLGLTLQGGLVLPLVLWGTTRISPWATLKAFLQSLVLAFGTGSGAAALPVSCLLPHLVEAHRLLCFACEEERKIRKKEGKESIGKQQLLVAMHACC